jgi:uncharacterized protein (TIGR03545 family)
MSTAGSVRSGDQSQYTPSNADGAASQPTKRKRTRFFRWEGIIPLLLVCVLLALFWTFFGERVIRQTIQEAATKALGAELDIADLDIHTLNTTVELKDIALADPFNVNRNLFEVKSVRMVLEPRPLLQKKIVVRQLSIADVSTGTTRARPARPVPAGGFAPQVLAALDQWAKQFKVPPLSLFPIDSIKALVLDPMQLKSVQAALAVARGTDSTKRALETQYADLRLRQTIDSSAALAARLQRVNVRTLGVDGVRRAIADVRLAAARVDSARNRVERLSNDSRRGVSMLQERIRNIDDARREDFDYARSLMRLPTFNAPDLGAAMFGTVTIDRFQKALYWTTLARQYAPPGLLPRETPGPTRMRRSGRTVHYVTPQSYPRFHIVRADMNATVSSGMLAGIYALAIRDFTTDPAIVGRPTLFAARREAKGSDLRSLRITGSMDHTTGRPREVINLQAAGVNLPTIPMPVLPYSIDPRRGTSELRFTVSGDSLTGKWLLHSRELVWNQDAGRKRQLNTIETFVVRVLTGVTELDLAADITGTVKAPRLAVKTNLDRQLADRLRAVIGEEVDKAEAKLRAQLDKIVDEKTAPLKARVAQVAAESEKRVADAHARLEAEKKKLDERLKALTRGAVPGLPDVPSLPGVRVPKLPRLPGSCRKPYASSLRTCEL